jgi:hypothetical protein
LCSIDNRRPIVDIVPAEAGRDVIGLRRVRLSTRIHFNPSPHAMSAISHDFEKLGVFYFGRQFDLQQGRPNSDLVLYDAKDLTTHAVCVGMTGSGKTGLCLTLLEEAAIDGIPAIVIDPKGDLSNLLLTFPDLAPADFLPWVDPQESTRKGQTPDEFAAATAATWKQGLAEWGQDGARIARFRDAVDIAIYTPGSNVGLPLTVLKSFAAPPESERADTEAFGRRVMGAVSGLLALLGIDADPLRSREHILLSNLMDRTWRDGRDLDMPSLIRQIQTPPFDKIGVMDLDSFFPAADRFGLAMLLNNLLASPGFQGWLEGEPVDVQRLLYTADGKPRVSIISISHLSDSERMFFVTILLNEVVTWMRCQPGTSSLRALLYMDEVFGYFPPTANPPSKLPMLTLLKQARAFGLGVVLATQNPVDLDYKGLSNAGTWFIGRLQTERDKARVLDGLEGASATAGANFDRAKTETILSSLTNRVFLMNNVHDDQPVVFQTRWALSYLRGPVTREQIQTLMAPRKAAVISAASPTVAPSTVHHPPSTATPVAPSPAPPTPSVSLAASDEHRPVLPPGIQESFLPVRGSLAAGETWLYRPAVLGDAKLHFVQAKAKVDCWQDVHVLVDIGDSVPSPLWDGAAIQTGDEPEQDNEPESRAKFASLAPAAMRAKSYTEWKTSLKNYLYASQVLSLWTCGSLKQTSQPDETDGEFRVRITHAAHEQRDVQVDKLRSKYASKVGTLQDRLRRAQQAVEVQKSQEQSQSVSAALSFGSAMLGALFGRKAASVANVTRAASTARAAGRVMSEKGDVARATESLEAVQQKLAELETEVQAQIEKIHDQCDTDQLQLDQLDLPPRKSDITVNKVALVWVPWKIDASGNLQPAS